MNERILMYDELEKTGRDMLLRYQPGATEGGKSKLQFEKRLLWHRVDTSTTVSATNILAQSTLQQTRSCHLARVGTEFSG